MSTNTTFDPISQPSTKYISNNRTTANPSWFKENNLILCVAASALSLIPPFRLFGNFAMRSIALLTTAIECKENEKANNLTRAASYTKLLAGGLAIFAPQLTPSNALYDPFRCSGSARYNTLFFAASLTAIVTDMAAQVFGLIQAAQKEDIPKFTAHTVMFSLDLSIGLATIFYEPAMMITACVVNAIFMGAIAIYKAKTATTAQDKTDAVCYGLLSVLGFARAKNLSDICNEISKRSYFAIKNTSNEKAIFRDKNYNIITTAEPGETAVFDIPTSDAIADGRKGAVHMNVIVREHGAGHYGMVDQRDDRVNSHIQTSLFQELPVTGSAIILKTETSRKSPKILTI